MAERSTSLDMPYIQPAQAQKHVTHNEAIELLDMIVQLTVEEFDAETPPPAPQEGQSWALGNAPTGDWAGQDGLLASFRSGGWLFVAPKDGWRAWGKNDEDLRTFTGGAWQSVGGASNNTEGLGINASFDATNKLAVSSDAILLTHDGAGHQVKVNKANAAETASLLFQSDWSGRAEMGLAGTDDFEIKVSADGVTWFTALSAMGVDGRVGISTVLNIAPGTTPASPVTGDVYFDSTTSKLRCFDGSVWQDLF